MSAPAPQLTELSQQHHIDTNTLQELLQSFNSFDKNRDGFISHADLKSVIKTIGSEHINIQDDEILELIKCADKDFDQLIHFEEYVILLKPFLDSVITNLQFSDEGIMCDSKTYCKSCQKPLPSITIQSNTSHIINNSGTSYTNSSTNNSEALVSTSVCTCLDSSQQSSQFTGDSAHPSHLPMNLSHNGVSTRFQVNPVDTGLDLSHHESSASRHSASGGLKVYANGLHYEANEKQDRNLRVLFNIYDKDKNGLITREEIADVMKGLGEDLSEEDLDEMMAGNDHIDFDQFKVLLLGDETEANFGDPTGIVANINNSLDGLTMSVTSGPVQVGTSNCQNGRSDRLLSATDYDPHDVEIVDAFINSPSCLKNYQEKIKTSERSPSLEIEIVETVRAANDTIEVEEVAVEDGKVKPSRRHSVSVLKRLKSQVKKVLPGTGRK